MVPKSYDLVAIRDEVLKRRKNVDQVLYPSALRWVGESINFNSVQFSLVYIYMNRLKRMLSAIWRVLYL